jgi:hypothetical protein
LPAIVAGSYSLIGLIMLMGAIPYNGESSGDMALDAAVPPFPLFLALSSRWAFSIAGVIAGAGGATGRSPSAGMSVIIAIFPDFIVLKGLPMCLLGLVRLAGDDNADAGGLPPLLLIAPPAPPAPLDGEGEPVAARGMPMGGRSSSASLSSTLGFRPASCWNMPQFPILLPPPFSSSRCAQLSLHGLLAVSGPSSSLSPSLPLSFSDRYKAACPLHATRFLVGPDRS